MNEARKEDISSDFDNIDIDIKPIVNSKNQMLGKDFASFFFFF